MTRPQTFVEHDILQLDASRGIHYQSFEDFWTRRMEPMQFIPADASGALRACREVLKTRAQEQWTLWSASRVAQTLGAGDDERRIATLPQAESPA